MMRQSLNRTHSPISRYTHPAFVVCCLVFLVCLLGGGSSRADVVSLLYVRPTAIAVIIFLIWHDIEWTLIRPIATLLALLAAICMIQLAPLPSAFQTLIPGHAQLDAIQRLNGTASSWRPLSIDPDGTLNALLSLSVPAAILLGLGAMNRSDRERLIGPLILAFLAGGILGVLQVSGGQDSPLYLYRNTYPGYAVGWFSNRNHHAVALACLLPLVRVWAVRKGGVLSGKRRSIAAVATAIFVLPLIIITGSRAGLLLGLLAMVASIAIVPPKISASRRTLWLIVAAGVVVTALVIAMLTLGRAASFDRLFQSDDLGVEGRFAYLPTEWRILVQFWPVGTGMGAFDPAIRMFEPDSLLHTTFFNHAHNDFLELAMVAGLPAIVLMAAGLLLLIRWTVAVFRPYRQTDEGQVLARAGAAILWLLGGASAVDYPLRSPLMAALAMLAAVWLYAGVRDRRTGVRLR